MKVLVIGLGDVGTRVADVLRGVLPGAELVLSSRPRGRHQSLAAVVDALGPARARFGPVDAADPSSVEALVRAERPDVIVNCACLLSPWHLLERDGPAAAAVGAAGLAVQLGAQLPLARSVAVGAAEAGHAGFLLNCSYPDVVNPVLAAQGLAPTIGAGNAQMVQARARRALAAAEPVRVVAHHAHVVGCMAAAPQPGVPAPHVFVGDDGTRRDDLAYSGEPIPRDRSWNTLTAAGVGEIVAALVGFGDASVSAPGPLGLPGGYPVRVSAGGVALDLPSGVSLDEARAWNDDAARADGVAAIHADGTVELTDEAAMAASAVDPRLAEPLRPGEEWGRWEVLGQALSA